MHITELDLNLLRSFDAVYRLRNVSRAAESLGLTQPATSHAITRLRLLLGDPLFIRNGSGVSPSPRAEQLAGAVAAALSLLSEALDEPKAFKPAQSRRRFKLHCSDIGEARLLPKIMTQLHRQAPGITLETQPLPHEEIVQALNTGKIDFAIGFLPSVQETERLELMRDSYIVLLRAGHPFLKHTRLKKNQRLLTDFEDLQLLDYAAVRTHAETLRILQLLKLDGRIKLTASHFLAVPDIVRQTDLAVLMPKTIAKTFAAGGEYSIIEPQFPLKDFVVSLHWSARMGNTAAHLWMRELILKHCAIHARKQQPKVA
jgi:DNA-binding transcriptional LysR family regulator